MTHKQTPSERAAAIYNAQLVDLHTLLKGIPESVEQEDHRGPSHWPGTLVVVAIATAAGVYALGKWAGVSIAAGMFVLILAAMWIGWARTLALLAATVLTALVLFATTGCSAPSAQQEAEDVAADAATAQMQAAIDQRCASVQVHQQLACAVDALAELQPDRWTPEDQDRGRDAAALIEGQK